MSAILVPFSAKRIATQLLVIAKLNGRKHFILRSFVYFEAQEYSVKTVQDQE